MRRGFQAFHTQRPLVLLFAMRINNLTVIYLQLCYFKKSFTIHGFRLEWTRFTFAVNSFSGSSSAVVVSNCYQLSLNFCHLLESQVKFAIYLSANLFDALIFVMLLDFSLQDFILETLIYSYSRRLDLNPFVDSCLITKLTIHPT